MFALAAVGLGEDHVCTGIGWKPILLGYINGIALTIIVGQIPKLLGLDIEADDVVASFEEILQELDHIH